MEGSNIYFLCMKYQRGILELYVENVMRKIQIHRHKFVRHASELY